ncbi:MAG: P-loop NTPase, partial [Nitrospirales bacterium]
GIMMFQKVNVPIMGIIENMSYFLCGHCGERTDIFDTGGGERAAEKLGVPFLGRIPIDPAIRAGGDQGAPVVLNSSSPQAEAFRAIAKKIAEAVKDEGGGSSGRKPLERLLDKIKRPKGSG